MVQLVWLQVEEVLRQLVVVVVRLQEEELWLLAVLLEVLLEVQLVAR